MPNGIQPKVLDSPITVAVSPSCLRNIAAENIAIAILGCRTYDDGVRAGKQVFHGYGRASVEGPTVGSSGAFGIDLIVHGEGDSPGLLAATFMDERVQARGQQGSGWNACDVEVKIGLIADTGQRGAGDLARIIVGSRQRKVHRMVR